MLVRTYVRLPEELVREVDRMVGARRRSRFVEEAIRSQLKRQKLAIALEKVAGSLKDVDIPGWETPEAASAWVANGRADDERRLEEQVRR